MIPHPGHGAPFGLAPETGALCRGGAPGEIEMTKQPEIPELHRPFMDERKEANMSQQLAAKPEALAEVTDLSGGILSVIARAASDPAVDVDKLERLLAMQERILAQDAEQIFNEAMKAAQEEIRPVVANKKNPQTKSDYANLEALSDAIDPITRSHGFTPSFGSDASPLPDHYRVTCRLAHTGGHARDYHADVPIDMTGIKGERNKTMTHGWGSAMTYGRRYLKLLIFDVAVTTKATRDDDGNAAGNGGPINKEQVAILNGLADAVEADKIAFCRYLKVDAITDIPAFRYNDAVHLLTQKNPKAARQYMTGGQ